MQHPRASLQTLQSPRLRQGGRAGGQLHCAQHQEKLCKVEGCTKQAIFSWLKSGRDNEKGKLSIWAQIQIQN